MADIRFHRADIQRRGTSSKDCAQRADLNRVTERSTGAVRFDIADLCRFETRISQRTADHADLGGAIRDRQAAARTILVDGAAPNHGANGITGRLGIRQPFEDK